MTVLNLAVDSHHSDSISLGGVSPLGTGGRQRGYRWGLDTLPLFPGCWPLPLDTYERRPELSSTEATALSAFVAHRFNQDGGLRSLSGRPPASQAVLESLDRLVTPLHAVLAGASAGESSRALVEDVTVALVLARMARECIAYWGWPAAVWLDLVNTEATFKARWGKRNLPSRPRLVAIAYVLGGVHEIVWAKDLMRSFVFGMVFGVAALRDATNTVHQVLLNWGYADPNLRREMGNAVATVLMLAGSPCLQDLRREHLELGRRRAPSVFLRGQFLKLSRALTELGFLDAPLPLHPEGHPFLGSDPMYRAGRTV